MMPNSRALRAAWDSAGDGGGSRRWLAGEAGEGEGERGAGAAADRGEPPAKADNRDEGWELFFYWADGTGMILFFSVEPLRRLSDNSSDNGVEPGQDPPRCSLPRGG
jgi:hypothetical protein